MRYDSCRHPSHTHTSEPALPVVHRHRKRRLEVIIVQTGKIFLVCLQQQHARAGGHAHTKEDKLPGMMTKEPWGSMATRHALRMLGVSEAEMPHMRHISLSRRLRDCRFLLLSRMLQSGTRTERTRNSDVSVFASNSISDTTDDKLGVGPLKKGLGEFTPLPFNSPCPIRPSRPITTLHGTDVICTSPKHQSHSFCKPNRRAEPFFLRALGEKNTHTHTHMVTHRKTVTEHL